MKSDSSSSDDDDSTDSLELTWEDYLDMIKMPLYSIIYSISSTYVAGKLAVWVAKKLGRSVDLGFLISLNA